MIQETDAVVIGAGPVGLFQVFQLGLQGLAAHIIDALPYAGGQCVELYGDKPIYDIPALADCTGQELTQRLCAQIAPFAPTWHLGQQVDTVAALDKYDIAKNMDYISTAGGAFLEFMEGKTLPAVAALEARAKG